MGATYFKYGEIWELLLGRSEIRNFDCGGVDASTSVHLLMGLGDKNRRSWEESSIPKNGAKRSSPEKEGFVRKQPYQLAGTAMGRSRGASCGDTSGKGPVFSLKSLGRVQGASDSKNGGKAGSLIFL